MAWEEQPPSQLIWIDSTVVFGDVASPGICIAGVIVPGLSQSVSDGWTDTDDVSTIWDAVFVEGVRAIPGIGVAGVMIPGVGNDTAPTI